MRDPLPFFTDQDILEARSAKRPLDPSRPVAFHVEPECTADGTIERVATIFLANRECPFRCLMCDLWQDTTDETVAPGAIPHQIDVALAGLPDADHIKLYNSGNFFDPNAIPCADYEAIARRVNKFKTVIVENHPRLCGDRCLQFRDLLDGRLEIALGLETIHAETLGRLNKRMRLVDFERAASFLRQHNIDLRTFILLNPPFIDPNESTEWTLRSIAFAFDAGVQCCAVVPTRTGNGIMEIVETMGYYVPPTLASMETVLEAGIGMRRGRVFIDLWDVDSFIRCVRCGPERIERLRDMNLFQRILPPIACDCGTA
ncbi:MAG: radical SAM protein [Rhodothermales bacterium]